MSGERPGDGAPPEEARARAILCAWLDGESEADARPRLARALRERPDLARRLAVWRRNDSALRAAFAQPQTKQRPQQTARAPQTSATLEPLRAPEGAGAAPALIAATLGFLAGAAFGALALAALFMGP
jgi:anti-sigma factor RsiW